jgi:hypothetical protein
VLSLPVNAQRQDTRATGDFRKWMVKHIDSWFAFARGLGLGIEQMEEIVLVTGLHLTRSWANIVFLEGHANGHASFGVRADNNVGITWQFLPGSVRGGMRSWGPEGMVCQFARASGMKLTWICVRYLEPTRKPMRIYSRSPCDSCLWNIPEASPRSSWTQFDSGR